MTIICLRFLFGFVFRLVFKDDFDLFVAVDTDVDGFGCRRFFGFFLLIIICANANRAQNTIPTISDKLPMLVLPCETPLIRAESPIRIAPGITAIWGFDDIFPPRLPNRAYTTQPNAGVR